MPFSLPVCDLPFYNSSQCNYNIYSIKRVHILDPSSKFYRTCVPLFYLFFLNCFRYCLPKNVTFFRLVFILIQYVFFYFTSFFFSFFGENCTYILSLIQNRLIRDDFHLFLLPIYPICARTSKIIFQLINYEYV